VPKTTAILQVSLTSIRQLTLKTAYFTSPTDALLNRDYAELVSRGAPNSSARGDRHADFYFHIVEHISFEW
jgi:hypothetical protein